MAIGMEIRGRCVREQVQRAACMIPFTNPDQNGHARRSGHREVQGLLVFRNSDQFERLMHLDGVVSECGGDILPSVQSQQIQDGIANAG